VTRGQQRVRARGQQQERAHAASLPSGAAEARAAIDHRALAPLDGQRRSTRTTDPSPDEIEPTVTYAEWPRIAPPYGSVSPPTTASCTVPPRVIWRSDPTWPSKKLPSSSCTAYSVRPFQARLVTIVRPVAYADTWPWR